eukprot:SAG31_NODE_1494_length_8106_cov_7.933183_4_plen_68_part_00
MYLGGAAAFAVQMLAMKPLFAAAAVAGALLVVSQPRAAEATGLVEFNSWLSKSGVINPNYSQLLPIN